MQTVRMMHDAGLASLQASSHLEHQPRSSMCPKVVWSMACCVIVWRIRRAVVFLREHCPSGHFHNDTVFQPA